MQATVTATVLNLNQQESARSIYREVIPRVGSSEDYRSYDADKNYCTKESNLSQIQVYSREPYSLQL